MLQEQGPLIIDKDGKLMENPYAWTTVANFFVVESPAGALSAHAFTSLQPATS